MSAGGPQAARPLPGEGVGAVRAADAPGGGYPATAVARQERVAVIGAGWAGCAAAVHLAEAGVHVMLLDQAHTLGGRARTVTIDGLALDNGQHLLLGAYGATLRMLERVHGRASEALFARLPLTLVPFGKLASPSVVAAPQPRPWRLVAAVARAHGFTWGERLSIVRTMRAVRRALPPVHATVQEWLATGAPRVYATLWAPLCTAALNTPAARASARIFANVLRRAFGADVQDSDFLLATAQLGAVLPDPAAAFVVRHGGVVRRGTRVRAVVEHADGVTLATGHDTLSADAAIVAVGPHQLAALGVHTPSGAWNELRRCTDRFTYESTTTIYLGYRDPAVHPPIARLDDAPGQWVFERGKVTLDGRSLHLLAVVISGSGAHDHLDHGTLVAAADAQLRRALPALSPLAFGRVIAERRATYACTPGVTRPMAGSITPRIALAGDYTHPELPATLEAAVASGAVAAAEVLDGLLRAGQRTLESAAAATSHAQKASRSSSR